MLLAAVSCCMIMAGGVSAKPTQKSKYAAMAIDANTGRVLENRYGDAARYPASLTKMMTLYMVFERIEQGRLSLKTRIPYSATAAAAPPSKLGLKAGSSIAVGDAIKALVTKSANDVAVAVAEYLGGSEAKFARAMTAKARSFGMSRTTFKNASGLPNSQQKTTARDMLTLALRLQDDFPMHYKLFRTRYFTFKGKTYRNHNTLLRKFAGTDGIKTGYTRASGFNLVSSVRRDGRHVVAAVFGGKTARSRNSAMRALLHRSLRKASKKKTRVKPVLVAKPARVHRPRKAPRVAASPPPPAQPDKRIAMARVRAVDARELVRQPRHVNRQPGLQSSGQERRRPPGFSQAFAPALQKQDLTSSSSLRRPHHSASTTAWALPSNTRWQGRTARGETVVMKGSVREGQAPRAQARMARGQGPGRPPSTLQQQSALLDGNAAMARSGTDAGRTTFATAKQAHFPNQQRSAYKTAVTGERGSGALNPPRANSTATPRGGYAVQVGAYADEAQARQQLSQVAQKAEGLVTGYRPRTLSTQKGRKQLYKAQFAGFQADNAMQTCNALRRQAIDCFVTLDQ